MKQNNQAAQALRQRIQGARQSITLLLSEIKALRADAQATRQKLDALSATVADERRAHFAMMFGAYTKPN